MRNVVLHTYRAKIQETFMKGEVYPEMKRCELLVLVHCIHLPLILFASNFRSMHTPSFFQTHTSTSYTHAYMIQSFRHRFFPLFSVVFLFSSVYITPSKFFFLCFSLCARIDFRHSAEKKIVLFPIFCVESQHKVCVSAPAPSTVPSTRSRARRSTAFPVTAGKGSRAIFSASRFAKKSNFQNKKRREKRLPVDDRTAHRLIVVIGEGSRVLPEGEPVSFRMINCMRKRLVLPVAYD